MRTPSGTYIVSTTAGESVRAFVPDPLPPDPPIQLNHEDYDLMEEANRALGRLDGATLLLPDTHLFLYLYIRKEAVLSSQIEGTQSSLSDLLLFENNQVPGVPLDDVVEVSNYVAALDHGISRLREGFPLSLRLIRDIHTILLSKGRGSTKMPGEMRTSQNWIGGTRPGDATFIPPPPDKVIPCMGALEAFLHDQPTRTPTLIKAALSHVQFETIHPFLDGNGRLGRLLITLILCAESALSDPLLYLSLYFKTHRSSYYDLLQRVRTHGDWQSWMRFFLTGVRDTANHAARTARDILTLFESDRDRIAAIGRGAGSALRVHECLQIHPLLTVAQAEKDISLTKPTIVSAVNNLEKLGIVREITGKQRYRVFLYDRYLKVLDEGTDV